MRSKSILVVMVVVLFVSASPLMAVIEFNDGGTYDSKCVIRYSTGVGISGSESSPTIHDCIISEIGGHGPVATRVRSVGLPRNNRPLGCEEHNKSIYKQRR